MNTQLCFTKIAARQNILFDEFFLEATEIEFIAFNYDGAGAAICRCDAKLQHIDQDTVNKILFGVTKERLGGFIRGIFDPDTPTADLERIGGLPRFRLVELNELSKYSLGNLAKKIHKELQTEEIEQFHYYAEQQAKANPAPPPRTGLLHGNTRSGVFHWPGCAFYEGKECTAKFLSREEAVAGGYKPCKLCD
jgi:hypothetical protein